MGGEVGVRRIALGLQYDGSGWAGYQKQQDRDTVQGQLELALQRFTTRPVDTVCAGRTDRGVHALGQVVHFDTELDRPAHAWVRGLNAYLPRSIGVRWAHVLPDIEGEEFHARFVARSRTYYYVLNNHPVRSPLLAGRTGWSFRPLDVERMHEAAQCLLGWHDFSAFRSSQCQAKSPLKLMHEIDITRHGDTIVFKVRASAFLHHMVRNLVGSLVYIGLGREPVGWMASLLEGKDRTRAAPTFMPDGLYLAEIEYDDQWGLPRTPAGAPLPFLFS